MTRNKRREKRERVQKRFCQQDFEVRPITPKDEWCKVRSGSNPKETNIVTISKCFEDMEIEIFGAVIRSCFEENTLKLQVAPGKKRLYKIKGKHQGGKDISLVIVLA